MPGKKRAGPFLSSALWAAACIAALLSGCGSAEKKTVTTGGKEDGPVEKVTVSEHEDKTFFGNIIGEEDGYSYELWKDTGDAEMTVTGEGNFSCQWQDINNALFRKGRKLDCTQTYEELENITVDYGVDYRPDGNSYMCVYGWTREPLVEFYIVETWGSWRPPGAADSLGTVEADGGVYDIYRTIRCEQPSIDGTRTFDQYWSVRQTKPEGNGTKVEGTISVTRHFDAWARAGLKLGKMYEVALNIEGYQSKGQAEVYRNILTIRGDHVPDDSADVKTPAAVGPLGNE